jgi:hypothetical protein
VACDIYSEECFTRTPRWTRTYSSHNHIAWPVNSRSHWKFQALVAVWRGDLSSRVAREFPRSVSLGEVWDEHRLILPVSYFVEKPFQNWTKGSPAVLGTVLVYADFMVPVQEVRAEFERILATTNLFDGKAKALEVTNLTADKVELRALVSAVDSGRLWDLQCLVREELLTWLQSRGRDYIPIRRVGTVAGRGKPVSNGVVDGD